MRHVPRIRWWHRPMLVVERASDPEHLARSADMIERHGDDSARYLRDVAARLELGVTTPGQWQASGQDRIAVDRAWSVLRADTGRVELFVLRLRLHNAGSVPWRDRLLYRLGPPVTSATPFTPGVLPVPDTDPGQSCEVLIPGRSQWLYSRAEISYVMVFPDFTSCAPGRVCGWIDTRAAGIDHTLPLPAGFPTNDPRSSG